MSNRTAVLVIILNLVLLSGCNPKVVKETKTEVLSPPAYFLEEVTVEPPPNIAEYENLQCIDKEEILVNKFDTQTLNLEIANEQIRSIREWVAKQLKLYQKE